MSFVGHFNHKLLTALDDAFELRILVTDLAHLPLCPCSPDILVQPLKLFQHHLLVSLVCELDLLIAQTSDCILNGRCRPALNERTTLLLTRPRKEEDLATIPRLMSWMEPSGSTSLHREPRFCRRPEPLQVFIVQENQHCRTQVQQVDRFQHCAELELLVFSSSAVFSWQPRTRQIRYLWQAPKLSGHEHKGMQIN